ncbi:hypothetical protein UA38_11685 [Photobacterium kishitanii]|uniref:Uncharacterized protein n=1 Tax=Photobacterium kishitanii TaxID=318456 RepID=A0AAX0YTI4_9GAMM|nr:hypothetical protein [Photobacterium kishitanii]KJG57030.1 hypothetical protein UA38_11685 [Photobacterium kishitanii]KJG60554.1 hypothetical protein UA42_14470 [Photobacterium kishitanii]KJG64856.1 hypothetical protein UA40_14165 [Photobacterium kishitanii]KJG68492.1 hypothetical protein UA41_16575 [Photobacterium kishitanii]OBU31224.1 hypothetical protein AYY23_20135 [Photobacterium kishitanii]
MRAILVKIITVSIAVISFAPNVAVSEITHGSYLELEALKRLELQVTNIIPKVRQAHSSSNHAQLRANYSRILIDVSSWKNNISVYIDGSLKSADSDLYKQSYTTFKSAGKSQFKRTEGSSESERVQLEKIRNLIVRMKPLIREAESTANPEAKMFFRYEILWGDHAMWVSMFDSYLSQLVQASDFTNQ